MKNCDPCRGFSVELPVGTPAERGTKACARDLMRRTLTLNHTLHYLFGPLTRVSTTSTPDRGRLDAAHDVLGTSEQGDDLHPAGSADPRDLTARR